MNKINHFIEEHTVLCSILLYFVGYLFVGSLIIFFTPSKYQIYTRLVISLFLFFFMIRISRKKFDNIIEQINEVLGTGSLITAVTTFIIFVITNTVYIKSNYNIMKPIAIHMLLNTLSLIITI